MVAEPVLEITRSELWSEASGEYVPTNKELPDDFTYHYRLKGDVLELRLCGSNPDRPCQADSTLVRKYDADCGLGL